MDQKLITSEQIPQVHLNFMNNIHREELEIVSELLKLVSNRMDGSENEQEISEKLSQWYKHTRDHFGRENQLMEEIGFPAYLIHKGEHESALKLLESVVEAWENGRDVDQLYNYIVNLWQEWFLAHVNSMDRVTAQFAANNGYSEE